MIPASELDRLLLSFCGKELRKVARIAGNTLKALEEQGVQLDGTVADQIDAPGGIGQQQPVGGRRKHQEVALQRSALAANQGEATAPA